MNWPPCKCFNCNKVSHLAAQGCAPKKAQINYIINKPEEIMNLSAPLTPDGILDDALSNFNWLSDHMKDTFIQKYKGELQNFQDV